MKIIFIFIALCISAVSRATTYYISPSGNDITGTGTATNPWKTLYRATILTIVPGDIIHVNSGTYVETLQSSLKPGVSIEGEDSSNTIIKSTLTANQVEIISARSLIEGSVGNQHISNLKFDGQGTTSWAITVFARSNVKIYNCTFINFDDSGVLFVGKVTFDGTAPTIYATGNEFYNCTMHNNARYTTYGRGNLWAIGQQGMLIHDNVMTQVQRPLGSNGWLIKCTNFTRGVKIYNNNLTKIPFHGNYGGDGGWDFAIEMADEQGVEIYNNTIQGSIDLNRQTKGAYAYSAWVHDNYIYQPVLNTHYESGIVFEYGTETAIIERNIINNCSGALLFNTRVGDAISNITIKNNLFSNIGIKNLDGNNGSFIIISSEGTPLNSYTLDHFDVYNNTMVASLGNRPNWGIELGNVAIGYEKNINIKNNIIMNIAAGWITSNSSVPMDNIALQYNNTYNNGNSNNPVFAGAQPTNLTNTNNVHVVPQFMSATNFQLQSASPCIDAGTFVGLTYSGSAPDHGYMEFGASGNASPTANAGADQTITLPTNSVNLTGSGTDPDGTITTYTWTKVAGPTAGTITTATAAATSVTGMAQGTYKFELKVTDNAGAVGRDTMQVVVNAAANIAPTANAGADQTITLPIAIVTLTGSGTDPDGTIASYNWTKISGPTAGTISTPLLPITTVITLGAGTYKFELKVTDNAGAVGRDTMQLVVNPLVNTPPTANAGVDQTITLPTSSVSLSGSGTDPDGTIASYAWTKVAGPTAGTITNAAAAATTVTGLAQGTYKFELKVTDNSGAVGRDTMQVTVNAAGNVAPTANAGVDQTITLPTSSVSLSGSGTDTDGTIASYAWTKVAGPTAGTITNAAAAATTVTGLAQGTYKFELKVTDNSGAVGRDTMQVTVNAAGNVAPTANAGVDQTITLPTSSVSLSGSGTDTDGTIAAYAWTKVAGPTAGTITNAAAAATTVTGLAQGTYKFELKVTDNSGAAGRDTMQVTVNAAAPPPPPSNVAPTANAGVDQTITLPINTVTLTGSGTDTDGTITGYSWVKIAGPAAGSLTNPVASSTPVTGLVQGTYKFELTVTDNSGATGKDTMQVIVNAAAPAPNVAPTANAGVDQTITLPTNIVTLTGNGTDTDGTIVGYSWVKIAGPAAGTITNPVASSTPVTGLVQGTYKFELTVTDNSGATGRDTMQVIVNAAAPPPPPSNVAPTANAGVDQTITLPTSTITLTGNGTDPDGTIIGYNWVKIAGPAAGTITNSVASSTPVTGLVQGTYKFELTVTDNSGATGKDTMQVTVNAAPNVAPTANANIDQTITLPSNSVSLFGSGTDPDGSIVAYAWTKISGPSAGTITNAAAATTTVTGLVQGTYLFELKVTDNSGATDRDTMQVTVNPAANIPPTANAGSDINITLPTNTVTLTGHGTDPDGTIIAYLWTRISGPAAGSISNQVASSTPVTGLAAGVYKYELKVTDNNGATDTDTVQVVVFAPNVPPTANAGLNQSITLPTNTANLSGSGTDVDGTIIFYLWTKISGPAGGTITNASSAATSVTGLTQGVYVFELRVTDNSGATAKATVQVTVNPENIAPIANAGPDQTVMLPGVTNVTLAGSGTDVDGTIVSYSWKHISGPADKLTSRTTATTHLDNVVAGTYKLELTVTDNKGATGKDTVSVIAAVELAPSGNSVKVYPNPVVDVTTVSIGSTNNAGKLIVVTDVLGKTVYTQKIPAGTYNAKQVVNMSALAKGIYLITVHFNAKDIQTVKVMKQ